MLVQQLTDPELPGYDVQPVVSAIPRNPAFPLSQLSVHESSKVIGFGELLQGTVEVVPRHTISCSKILLKLVILECATGPCKLLRIPKWKGRQITHLLTSIPTATMKAGSKYVYPFITEIPQLSEDSICSCGCAHSRLPPSIGCGREAADTEYGASIRYLLTVSVVDTSLVCVKELYMEPREPVQMNYAGLTDGTGFDIDREYTSSNRITSGRFSSKLLGYISLTGSPMVCDAYGYSRVKLGLDVIAVDKSALLSPRVTRVTSTLFRVVYSSISKIGLTLAASNTTSEVKSKVGDGQTTYLKSSDDSGDYLDLLIKIPVREKLMPPPFTSCYVAVKYELRIDVHLKSATGTITLPLSFGSSQFATPVESPKYTE